jgi:L-fucose mutarotase
LASGQADRPEAGQLLPCRARAVKKEALKRDAEERGTADVDDFGDEKMLKGIPPVVSPELMHLLMKMGHGDEIVIADGNFPADSKAQQIVRADGLGVLEVLEAVLKFLPIDKFVDDPVAVMKPVNAKDPEPPIWKNFRRLLEMAEGRRVELSLVERFEFYEKAEAAYCIVATSESALYANIILKKGVVTPQA